MILLGIPQSEKYFRNLLSNKVQIRENVWFGRHEHENVEIKMLMFLINMNQRYTFDLNYYGNLSDSLKEVTDFVSHLGCKSFIQGLLLATLQFHFMWAPKWSLFFVLNFLKYVSEIHHLVFLLQNFNFDKTLFLWKKRLWPPFHPRRKKFGRRSTEITETRPSTVLATTPHLPLASKAFPSYVFLVVVSSILV